jgi:hypothetical protein
VLGQAMPMTPTYTIIARALADMRSNAWCSAQLTILDMAIDAISTELADANPRFSEDLFRIRCKYNHYRPIEERA